MKTHARSLTTLGRSAAFESIAHLFFVGRALAPDIGGASADYTGHVADSKNKSA